MSDFENTINPTIIPVVVVGTDSSEEGVTFILNRATNLKTGNVKSDRFYVSWDKIGELLFDGYAIGLQVPEMKKLRNED